MKRLQTALAPLDLRNERHLKVMYEVRTHPEVASRLSGPPPKDYESHLQYLQKPAPGKVFFMITADRILCGYCQLALKGDEIELGWALHPAWWGKSIGSTAVKLLIEHVKKEYSAKVNQICLVVKRDNSAAIHIYKKSGFMIHSSDELKHEHLMYLRI
jgi:RimJ/RimL family protein N-acetyltransferase